MGKNSRKIWKKKKQDANAEAHVKGVRLNYESIVKENADFEKYYKMQKICPEEEWELMMKHLREPLPTAFRLAGSKGEARALLHVLQKHLLRDALLAGKTDSEATVRAEPLPWYPENLGWNLNLTRTDIRRNEAYFRLHNFLISETATGNISRQEAVSMIPPLALQVESHHKVLDMCAAPGSKTAQIIEMIHKDDEPLPKGFVVANDVDNKRCYLLVHQGKRLNSPAFVVTNHDASRFPDLHTKDKDGTLKKLKFDRVLCDVPCSGDGTMRKNIDVWKKWAPSNGLYLHQVQYQVLKRGLELLEVGGKLVYSTCSLNPIEDEGVIHRMLKDAEGSVELQDIDLPELKHCKGMSTWVPCTRDLMTYEKFEEVPDRWQTTLRPNMFPPSPEDAPKFKLDKCIRVLPHQQDTGGFFIALLTKTKRLPWEKAEVTEEENNEAEQADEVSSSSDPTPKPYLRGPPKKVRRLFGYKEDPYFFMSEDNPIWPQVRDFYTLDASLDCTNFLRRTEDGKVKNIYVTTQAARDFVQNNDKIIKIINVGVKAFARADKKWTPCEFRLCQEGLAAVSPFVKGRRMRLPQEDLQVLLVNDDEKPALLELFSEETRKAVETMERGSLILDIDLQVENDGPICKLELVGWKGNSSLRAYIQKPDRIHYLRLCGADVSKYETNKFQDKGESSKNGDNPEEDKTDVDSQEDDQLQQEADTEISQSESEVKTS